MSTIGDLLSQFTFHLAQTDRSPATIRAYASDVKAFLAWWQDQTGASDLGGILPAELREYKLHLLTTAGVKPRSVNRKLQSVKRLLVWVGARGDATVPVTIPKPVPVVRLGPRWLDRKEQLALRRTVGKMGRVRDVAIVQLLLNTGLRIGELAALTWDAVAMSERKGIITVKSGKGMTQRKIPLNKEARSALAAMGHLRKAGTTRRVFTGQRGPLGVRGLQNILEKAVRSAGLGAVSAHSLRHTFCKNLIDRGVGLETIAALAGHRSIEITRQYCEPSPRDLETAVSALDDLS